jgi:hypothetical protein
MIRRLIDYLVEGLVPDDDSLCLIARFNGSGGFDPASPAILTRLNDFERGYRSDSITIGSSEYRFFGSCAEIRQRHPGPWPYGVAESFIQYITYISAVELIRDAYHKMEDVDPESLPEGERALHLERLADMEQVVVTIERARFKLIFEF